MTIALIIIGSIVGYSAVLGVVFASFPQNGKGERGDRAVVVAILWPLALWGVLAYRFTVRQRIPRAVARRGQR